MKTLLAAALVVAASCEDETSLMQGLARRVDGKLDVNSMSSRPDATAKLLETATKMMKNGAGVTPDVVTFIETTITEINDNVLSEIVDEHNRDQQLINDALQAFDDAITKLQAAEADILNPARQEYMDKNFLQQECRQIESHKCGQSRRCEEELEHLWGVVRTQEEIMREIHDRIHDEWCIHPPTSGFGVDAIAYPWHWTEEVYPEGAETSITENHYPVIELAADVRDFRGVAVTDFTDYIAQKPIVEAAWQAYNTKLLECYQLEEELEVKVTQCNGFESELHPFTCGLSQDTREARRIFGNEWHAATVEYNRLVEAIRQLEFDRKREWETLKIVTCLMETVYTHVIRSIESDEPCPTIESHPEETQAEITHCHVVEESLTANLTIIYGEIPPIPPLPPLVEFGCSPEFVWETKGHFLQQHQDAHVTAIQGSGLESYDVMLSAVGWPGCAAPLVCMQCEGLSVPAPQEDFISLAEECKVHEDYLNPGDSDKDTFRCLGGYCVPLEARCNGIDNCGDGSDEMGCETSWDYPAFLAMSTTEECREDAPAPGTQNDVQFRCDSGACTDVASRCNGVQNCADGSDESGCPSTAVGVALEATSGTQAEIISISVGDSVFLDRDYTFGSLGSFTGMSFVKMTNEDKRTPQTHVQMKVRLPQPLTVYVVPQEGQTLPWLSSDGWTANNNLVGVSYSGTRMTRHKEWSGVLEVDHYTSGVVFQKTFPAGLVSLPGNGGGDGSYLVFVSHPSHQPTTTLPPPPPTLPTTTSVPTGPMTLLSSHANCPQCHCEASMNDPHWRNSGCRSMFDDDIRWGAGPGFHLRNGASFTLYFPQPVLVDHIDLQQIKNYPQWGDRWWRGDFRIETFNDGVWTTQGQVDDVPVGELPMEANNGLFRFQLSGSVRATRVRMVAGNPTLGNGEIFRLEELQVFGWS